ncbi:MAG TPA: hypothetical protein VFU19_00765 [Iamia sp.]|nr:hypothetical protein [Iamia sp.]
MTDRPSGEGGSARSDAASRLAALLADVVEAPAPPAGPDPDATQPVPVLPPPPAPEPVAEAQPEPEPEPDRDEDDRVPLAAAPAAPAPGGPLRKRPGGPWRRPVAPPPADEVDEDGIDEDEAEPVEAAPAPVAVAPPPPPTHDDDDHDEPADDDSPALAHAPRFTLRAVAFGVVFALLVAAVPALGWAGSKRLLDSRGGEIVEGGSDPGEPGFRALVEPTATAMVIHRDATGYPTSVTILSLGGGGAGGTVLLVPLTLEAIEASYFHTVIAGYDATRNDDGFRRSIEDVIGVSVPPPLIDVTDQSLATLVAPVAPLELTVSDPVVLEDGTTLQGPVSLSAEQFGPYLRATREGEPEIARLERMRDLWAAWLEAIGSATTPEPIGAAATGMGNYLRELAAGDPVVETLDVEQVDDYQQGTSYIPGDGMDEQIIDAVPFPLSPREGRRFSFQLLNGSTGETLPMPLVRDLIRVGGALVGVGNATELGQDETTILYKGEDWEGTAAIIQALLGDGVEIEQMSRRRANAEDEDMIITIGSDVLARYEEQEDGGG